MTKPRGSCPLEERAFEAHRSENLVDRERDLFDWIRDKIDENRPWISTGLYILLLLSLYIVKRSLSSHRLNRIHSHTQLHSKHYERRCALSGVVQAIGPDGDIYVRHIPLLHRLVRIVLFVPTVRRKELNNCIRIRLHSIVLPRNIPVKQEEQGSVSDINLQHNLHNESAYGLLGVLNGCKLLGYPLQHEMKHCDEPVSPECIDRLKSLLLHRNISFIPVEPDIRYARARVFLVDGLFRMDVEEKLVSEGWAAINSKSFSEHSGINSFWDKFKRKRFFRKLSAFEREAMQSNLGVWKADHLFTLGGRPAYEIRCATHSTMKSPCCISPTVSGKTYVTKVLKHFLRSK